jgi:DNA-binding PadR family transcriptional regulator
MMKNMEKNMKILTRQEEQILLAICQLKDNAYLVPIREQIKEFTGKYFSVGTIYAPLNRLRINGLLSTYLGKPGANRGGKAIQYYRLTEKGHQALEEVKRLQDEMWKSYAGSTGLKEA